MLGKGLCGLVFVLFLFLFKRLSLPVVLVWAQKIRQMCLVSSLLVSQNGACCVGVVESASLPK